MQDIDAAIAKFDELVDLAERAESRFERAAVYGATIALSGRFVGEGEWRRGVFDVNPSFLDFVEEVRRLVCVSVGYEHGWNRTGDVTVLLAEARRLIDELKRTAHTCGYLPKRSLRDFSRIEESERPFLRAADSSEPADAGKRRA